MALTNLSLEELDRELGKFLKVQSEFMKRISLLKNQVLAGPTMEEWLYDYTCLAHWPRDLNLNEKILLGALTWYLPDEVRCSFQLELEKNWGSELVEAREVLLLTKKTALIYLQIQNRFDSYTFFGNLLKSTFLRKFKLVSFRAIVRTRRGVKKLNMRDYKDKGSCRPDSNPEPVYNFRKKLSVEEKTLREIRQSLQTEILLSEVLDHLMAEIL